ncbi:PAS domain-containing protein [Candidatus Wolfebacteria bacterium]|nr:PAS domain-containing protein [Candidatus Wolfebacteria bacterium]
MKFFKGGIFELKKKTCAQKIILFFLFGSFLPIILISTISYFSARSILEEKAIERLSVISESKLGEIEIFFDGLKKRTSDWAFDERIRQLTEEIISGKCPLNKSKICLPADSLASYIKNQKFSFDKTFAIADVLDVNGNIISSTDTSRISKFAPANPPFSKENMIDQFGHFKDLNNLHLGDSMVINHIIMYDHNFPGPMIHIGAPLYSAKDSNQKIGFLVAHIVIGDIDNILNINYGKTESYLVNGDGYMLTPSRFVPDAILKQQVGTLPARACFSSERDFNGIYLNYVGEKVLGVSKCIPENFGVLITEVVLPEAFLSVDIFRNSALTALGAALILAILFIFFAGREFIPEAPEASMGPSSVSIPLIFSVLIIGSVGIGLSLFFTNIIDKFIVDSKTNPIFDHVQNHAQENNLDEILALQHGEIIQNSAIQEKLIKFSGGMKFLDIARINIFDSEGILVWSTMADKSSIGGRIEVDKVINALKGELVSKIENEPKKELGLEKFLEIYIPVFDENKRVSGIVEFYADFSEVVGLISKLNYSIFGSTSLIIVLMAILLFIVFNRQNRKIFNQSKELMGIIEKSPHGIFTINKKGIIESFNPKMMEMTGIKNFKEIIGLNVFDISIFQSSGLDKFLRAGFFGKSFDAEIHYVPFGGQNEVYNHCFGAPIFDAAGESVERLLLMVENITERKMLENEVAEYTKGLEVKVAQRTADLQARTEELERMNKLMVGREIKMAELKKEIKELDEKNKQ